MRSILAGVLLLGMALSVGGCSGLHRGTPLPQTYVLRTAAAPAVASTPAAGAPTLRVGRTHTAPGLDSDRIVLMRSDHRLDYFAASRWAAALPDVVDALTAETLRNTGVWGTVSESGGGFPADYQLQIQIRRFEADYTESSTPTVHVVLDCAFGRRTDRELVTTFMAEGHVPASANRLSAVISAFEQAANAALATVVERSSAALSASP